MIKNWTEDGVNATYYEGRLSLIGHPSMMSYDIQDRTKISEVAIGIDAPWIDQLATAVDALREIAEMEPQGYIQSNTEAAMQRIARNWLKSNKI